MDTFHPDKTIPAVKPTDTQRFQPVEPDAGPHGSERTPKPEVYYENGGTELHDVNEEPNGDVTGTDGNGIRFVIPKSQVGDWRKER